MPEPLAPEHEGERLQKVLARIGLGSRRVCEDLIVEGRVALDQGDTFGELEVSWVTGAPQTVSVGAADYEYEG